MFEFPTRLSLATQLAHSIRKAIADGAWTRVLPGERQLERIFQTSRPTLRTALHLLANEKLIEIRPGCRSVLRNKPSESGANARNRLVVLITGEPTAHLPLATRQGFSEMRAHLSEHGFSTDVLVCPANSPKVQQRKVEAFVRQHRVFCCLLRSVSQELQQWIAARSIPALVLGSCHAEVTLPSLDVDYRSVCRHATGVFLSKGHRRIALIMPSSGLPGDLASEQGFREAIERHGEKDGVVGSILRHNGSTQGLVSKLEELVKAPRRPTALLVAKPQHVFVVVMHLLRQGLRVPHDMSLISRDGDGVFGDVISHYPIDAEAYVHRLSRLIQKMVANGHLPAQPNLIRPEYFSAGTVRNLP